jgi:soluble lytic murein transglycosylase
LKRLKADGIDKTKSKARLMRRCAGRRLGIAAAAVAIAAVATAQPIPYTQLGQSPVAPSAPYPAADSEAGWLREALNAAKAGDIARSRVAAANLSDPLARKIALWALTDTSADSLGFYDLDRARRELNGWPRGPRRQAAAEKLLPTAGYSPADTIAWFGGQPPQTADGALALAMAQRSNGQDQAAASTIRSWWRDKVFEADAQARILAQFGGVLTAADHARRADILLYGQQGPAARDLMRLLTGDDLAAANARVALRSNARNADELYETLPAALQISPGVAFERAANLRRRDQQGAAIELVRYFGSPPTDEAATRIWIERRALIAWALRAGNSRAAYDAASDSGITAGADAAEAEFYAGWLALNRLKNPSLAEGHFAALAGIGSSPITRGRALYWQGRTAEAAGDVVAAAGYYGDGARYQTTFYGQLAAEKAGVRTLTLGKDPAISPEHRARFEANELVRAARLLNAAGATDLFNAFVLYMDDVLDTAEDQALLVDLALGAGNQDLAMRAARTAATRGFILPERAYPLVAPPSVLTSAEPAFSLSIARQESNFDPNARSGVGARGMMQLMPATARLTARKMGEPYSDARLTEAGYNMRLGATYLGDMVDNFSGSYAMAAAAYNAGPGRPREWVSFCGDPRAGGSDPLDFIECIPFSETRNYVMRTLETTLVYRARLNGGATPMSLSSDLKRGGYVYSAQAAPAPSPSEIVASR